jgi:hypothetical protein
MFGLPMEVITMLASTLGGAFMKMWSQAQADKAEHYNQMLGNFKVAEKSRKRAGDLNSKSDMSMKKLLVVSFMAMAGFILLAPLFGMDTVVPVEVTTGLLFWKETVIEYVQLEGVVTPEWLGHAIMAVVGLYFGQSISKRH